MSTATETSPNFGLLSYHDPRISALGTQADGLFAVDPSACLAELRLFDEVLAQRAAAKRANPRAHSSRASTA